MTRSNVADLLERGIRKVFMDEYRLRGSQFRSLYNVVNSQKRSETDVVTHGLGLYERKAEGQSPIFDSGGQVWKRTYTHATFALGLEITEEALEDELYGYYMALGAELGKSARYTQEVEAMDLFNDLSAELYAVNGSSYPILSTTHYLANGDTWSNRPVSGTDFSQAALETFLSAWRTNMVDQRGRKITPEPKILLVGPTDRWAAEKVLGTEKAVGSNFNDKNVVREMGLRLVVSDFMTDDGRWFLLGEPGDTALTYFVRKAHEVRRRDDEVTGNMLMVGRYRESHGASHATGIYGSP